MPATSETRVAERQILLVGPYGVLGTGVIDAVAENPKWGMTTAARRPPPTYQAQAAPPHLSVDLMDREGTTKAFSSLDKVTDLVFAAYVAKTIHLKRGDVVVQNSTRHAWRNKSTAPVTMLFFLNGAKE